MKITYQPLEANSPVKFVVTGFPVDEQIREEIEHFYKTVSPEADRKFLIYNAFKEQIFSGNADQSGIIETFEASPRPTKA